MRSQSKRSGGLLNVEAKSTKQRPGKVGGFGVSVQPGRKRVRAQIEPDQSVRSAAKPRVGESAAGKSFKGEGGKQEPSIGSVQFRCTIVPSSEPPEQRIIGL